MPITIQQEEDGLYHTELKCDRCYLTVIKFQRKFPSETVNTWQQMATYSYCNRCLSIERKKTIIEK